MKQKNPKVMREARDFSHVRFTEQVEVFGKMYKAKIKELLGVE